MMDPMISRVPPQAVEAEQATLGSMLLEKVAIDKARAILRPDDFYREAHRNLFDALLVMRDAGQEVDMTTLIEQLRQTSKLEVVGGIPYLSSLLHIVPSPWNVDAYARIVQSKAILRALISAGSQMEAWGYDTAGDAAEEVIDRAQQLLLEISTGRRRKTAMIPLAAVLDELQAQVDHVSTNGPDSLKGTPTGFSTLDFMTLGLQPEQFVTVTAPTGKGKTAFALDVLAAAAKSGRGAVPVFSAEMSRLQLARRMVAKDSAVNSYMLRAPFYFQQRHWNRFNRSLARMRDWPVFICDRSGLTIADIRQDCQQILMEQKQIALVVVDYIQLVSPGKGAGSREQEVAQISRGLKVLARDMNCPVLALSQQNEQGSTRESRAIEMDSDVIIDLRWAEQKDDSPLNKGDEDPYQDEKEPKLQDVMLVVRKQRDGAVGFIPMKFHGALTRFSQADEQHQEEGVGDDCSD